MDVDVTEEAVSFFGIIRITLR